MDTYCFECPLCMCSQLSVFHMERRPLLLLFIKMMIPRIKKLVSYWCLTPSQRRRKEENQKSHSSNCCCSNKAQLRETGGLFVDCLTSQQHTSVSQRRICSDNCTCCHTETEVADQTFYLTQSQCTDTGPTSPSADPITPGAWQGSHWSANV